MRGNREYASSSQLGEVCYSSEEVKIRQRKEKSRCRAMTLAVSSDAASGDQSSLCMCRLGTCRLGKCHMSSTPSGPCGIIQWASKFTRKLVKRSLGGEVHAFSETLGHISMTFIGSL